MSALFALYSAAILTTAALYTDARHRMVPNWLVVALALLWALAVSLAPTALNEAIWTSLLCGFVTLTVGYLFHWLGWLGGGDGKLMGALALWVGSRELGVWLLGTAFLGLWLVLFALARQSGDFRTRGIPFAWAIAPPAVVLLIARAKSLTSV